MEILQIPETGQHQSRAYALKQGGQHCFTDDTSGTTRGSSLTGPGYEPVGPLAITVDGVLKLLWGLYSKKASGPDKVPYFFRVFNKSSLKSRSRSFLEQLLFLVSISIIFESELFSCLDFEAIRESLHCLD